MMTRLFLTVAAAVGTAVIVAIGLTVVDLYLTGHAYGSITREIVTWRRLGMHLSLADIVMVAAATLAAAFAWRGGRSRA